MDSKIFNSTKILLWLDNLIIKDEFKNPLLNFIITSIVEKIYNASELNNLNFDSDFMSSSMEFNIKNNKFYYAATISREILFQYQMLAFYLKLDLYKISTETVSLLNWLKYIKVENGFYEKDLDLIKKFIEFSILELNINNFFKIKSDITLNLEIIKSLGVLLDK